MYSDSSKPPCFVKICLEVIAIFHLNNKTSIADTIIQNSLWHIQKPQTETLFHNEIEKSLKWLFDYNFLQGNLDDLIELTLLGKATFSASFDPRDLLPIFNDLKHSRKAVSLEEDFHLLYLVLKNIFI